MLDKNNVIGKITKDLKYLYTAISCHDNSNLTSEANKNISTVIYSYLNVSCIITVTGNGTITCTCDAAGSRLKKTTADNTVAPPKATTILYVAGSMYESSSFGGGQES